MNTTFKYTLGALGAAALVCVMVASVYAIRYFNAQNENAARKQSLTEPSISLEGYSCDIPPSTQTTYYSVTVRTSDANIQVLQSNLEDKIHALGGSVVASTKAKVWDAEAGQSNSGTINATVSVAKTDAFIASLKGMVATPDYTENESRSTNDSNSLRFNCISTLESLKGLAESEKLYLSQLSAGSVQTQYPSTSGPYPSLPGVQSGSPSTDLVQALTTLRQSATGYKSSLDSQRDLYNKTVININIRIIPG